MSVQSKICGFLGSEVGRRDTFGSGVIMFEADGGTLTSTLINFSEVKSVFVLDENHTPTTGCHTVFE